MDGSIGEAVHSDREAGGELMVFAAINNGPRSTLLRSCCVEIGPKSTPIKENETFYPEICLKMCWSLGSAEVVCIGLNFGPMSA